MNVSADNDVQISTIRAGELTSLHIDTWSQIQTSDARFDSPFFRPEFTQIVASARDDVEVAMLQQAGEVVGFFPFHRTKSNVGYPIGMMKNDFQGVIARRNVPFSPQWLIESCGLSAWHFSHLISSQEVFRPHYNMLAESPYIDLSDGYDEYRKQKRATGSNLISDSARKARKLAKAFGPLRFEINSREAICLELLIEWKLAQYRRTKARNTLAARWQRALFENAWKLQNDGFAGMLSVLYAGDCPVTIDLNLRSGPIMHLWCTAYDHRFAKYSPGIVELLKLVESACSRGVVRLDLGKGDESYKTRFRTGASVVAEGSVDFRPLAGRLRRAGIYARELVRASALRRPAQSVFRTVRSWTACR
jgi:CelD/BcsL family acetyltransferase involved in cellulose biosynthesis